MTTTTRTCGALEPGVVNTDICENSRRALGLPEWEQLSDAQLLELLPRIRGLLSSRWACWPKTSPPMTCAR
jgi:hypothetical protein